MEQGVIVIAGVTLGRDGGDDSLMGVEVEEALVEEMHNRLLASLADPKGVEDARRAVDLNVRQRY